MEQSNCNSDTCELFFVLAGMRAKLSSYVKSINKYSLTNLNQYLKKQVGDEVDFLHVNRH